MGSLLTGGGPLVETHGFSCSAASGILVPQPGTESPSPALERRFLTTGPSGTSWFIIFKGYTPSVCVCVVTQSHLTLCNPMDCSPVGSSVHGDSPARNTGVDCHALLQGIFQTQGLNPGLPHCRQILYSLWHQGSTHSIYIYYKILGILFYYTIYPCALVNA